MSKTHKALSTLKRNFYGTIILGCLLPVYASSVLEVDPQAAGLVGTALIWISIINLSYAKRIERGLIEDAQAFTRYPSARDSGSDGSEHTDTLPVKL